MYNQEQTNKAHHNSLITKINASCFAINEKEFIKDKFKKQYDADINITYPYIASIQDYTGILCAAGFRFAKNENLFLEQYLSIPIEEKLGVKRDSIVEIGNLAVDDFTKLFQFLAEVSAFLIDNNIETVCITATQRLSRILQKRNIQGNILVDASQDSLNHSAENWGSYYATNPKVYTFNLKNNINKLHELSNGFKKEQGNVYYK